mmetsp:Transcript_7711/g.10270  ORF Transcript_7711/g.10270 Transcript_7711/m.10270 type:complete len:265 (+) Transcript_7711:53-847(+)
MFLESEYPYHILCCLVTTLLGIVINISAQKLLPKDLIFGVPRWNYYVSIFTQLLTFPTIVISAWASKNFEFEWFEASWDSHPSMKFEWLFIYILSGYLAKDFLVEMDLMLYLHHIVCLGGTIAWIFLPFPGVTCFMTGTMLLEFGSMSYNMWSLYPNLKLSNPVFFTIMTASNTLSLLCVWHFSFTQLSVPVAVRATFFLVTLILTIFRQKTCMDCIASFAEDPSKNSVEEDCDVKTTNDERNNENKSTGVNGDCKILGKASWS